MQTIKINNFDLDKIANSGQCFRMNKIDKNTYETIAYGKHLIVEALSNNNYKFYCNENDFKKIWYNYFDLETNYDDIIKSIDPNDVFLNKATEFGYGIRILKQEPWEMLISFIISQRKNIPAIKKSVECLCSNYGEKIADGKYAFPNPCLLANQTIESLNTCSLGYRTRYIVETSNTVANNIINLDDIKELDDNDLFETLNKFTGVGKKVANCIMLFGYYRVASFPIDVWIERIMQREYSNNFDPNTYPNTAGILQQYMFYYAQNSIDYKFKQFEK